MKTYNKNIIHAMIVASACMAGCQSEAEKQGFSKQEYTIPPENITTEPRSPTYPIDMGGLVVSMPNQPEQKKFSEIIPNVGIMTMYQSEILKGLRGSDGVYIVATVDYSLNSGLIWNAKRALDGSTEETITNAKKQRGDNWIILSNKDIDIVGLQGKKVSGYINLGNKTMQYQFIALAEENISRIYLFIFMTGSIVDTDAQQIMSSIHRK